MIPNNNNYRNSERDEVKITTGEDALKYLIAETDGNVENVSSEEFARLCKLVVNELLSDSVQPKTMKAINEDDNLAISVVMYVTMPIERRHMLQTVVRRLMVYETLRFGEIPIADYLLCFRQLSEEKNLMPEHAFVRIALAHFIEGVDRGTFTINKETKAIRLNFDRISPTEIEHVQETENKRAAIKGGKPFDLRKTMKKSAARVDTLETAKTKELVFEAFTLATETFLKAYELV